jgi:hypothetical protein
MAKLNLKTKSDNDNKDNESKFTFLVLIGKKKVKKSIVARNELAGRMLLFQQLKDKEKVKAFQITDCL